MVVNSKAKSVLAIVAGLALGAILATGTDFILESAGLMKLNSFKESPVWVVAIVIIYRLIFNIAGSYLTAKLAPAKPMKHALILGTIGMFLSLLGSIMMWEKALPWYNIAIILIAFPSAYIGGKFYIKHTKQVETK